MTTDTKAVARWKPYGSEIDLDSNGEFVLFTDHERIVEEIGLLWARELVKRDEALATSRAEVEGLRSVAIELRQELRDNALDAGQEPYNNPSANFVIDAAMEKGNV